MNRNPLPRLSPAAWLTLITALLLWLGSLAQVAYRFTLPTDGWAVLTEEISGASWMLYANRVGAESALQPGDVLLTVDGIAVAGTAAGAFVPPPAGWRAGQSVTVRLQRGRVERSVAMPVVHWTPAALARHNLFDPVQLAANLGALLLLAVAWFTFLRRPELPAARALLLLSTAVGAASLSGFLPDGLSVQFDQTAYWLTGFFSYMIFGTVLAPALLTFTLVFPGPKRLLLRRPWLTPAPLVAGGLLLLALVLGAPPETGWLMTLGLFTLAIASLGHAWLTQRDAVSRAQLRWAVSGLVLGLGLFMLNFPLAFNWVTHPALITLFVAAQSLSGAVIGAGLAVAVLRYRLFDIDLIIRKTLVYGLLTSLLALVYFGSVVLLQGLVGQAAGERSPLVIVLSTLFIAALFAPLRRRLQRFIDRRFFRRKYDAEQVLARFARTARDEVALESLTAAIRQAVDETVKPAAISIWLKG